MSVYVCLCMYVCMCMQSLMTEELELTEIPLLESFKILSRSIGSPYQ